MASTPEKEITDIRIRAMGKALELAACGRIETFPNPMVGAVILDRDGNFAGDGFHRRCGAPHAEVVAISAAGEAAAGGTMVVSLEPCCHHGRTGPCTDAIIRAGISRVVIAMSDPDPRVSGKGIRELESAGIEVETGILTSEAEKLNRVYLNYLRTGGSWVNLKVALSLDGKVSAADGSSRWISCDLSRQRVHKMRASVHAIMTGAGTVRRDDPELTIRLSGEPQNSQPTRIVVTGSGDFGESMRVFRGHGRVIIAAPSGLQQKLAKYTSLPGVELWELPLCTSSGGIDLAYLLQRTAEEGLGEILCEAGSGLSTRLLRDRLVRSVSIFTAPLFLGGEGKPAFEHLGIRSIEQALRLENISSRRSGSDFLTEGEIVYRV